MPSPYPLPVFHFRVEWGTSRIGFSEVMAWMKTNGHPLPVLRSQNLPGAIEHNRRVGAAYTHRLSRPLA